MCECSATTHTHITLAQTTQTHHATTQSTHRVPWPAAFGLIRVRVFWVRVTVRAFAYKVRVRAFELGHLG